MSEMTLVEHLGELRRRLLWVIAVFLVGLIIGLYVSQYLITYFKSVEPAASIQWNVFSPWDSLRMYMNFSFIVAVAITLPTALYHIWAFARPGLREEEQKASLMYIPFAFILFLVGLSFGYFVVFPMAFLFTTFLTERLGLIEMYGIQQYFSFMFNIVLPIAIIFELPIVVMFLTKLGILSPEKLKKMRRIAYMVLVILSTLITPPDVISAIMVAIPMILLYELSVFLSQVVYRSRDTITIDERKETI